MRDAFAKELTKLAKKTSKLVLLSGDIGSGKSTVLQAIEFALFGTRRDQLSAESLLRHGEIQGSVELAFNIKGEDISIRRNLRKTKDSIKQEAGFIIRDNVKKRYIFV